MKLQDTEEDPGREARVLLSFPLDLHRTLAIFRYGTGDPAYAVQGGAVWRAMGTPHGPASARFELQRAGEACLVVRAWGPGAEWVLQRAGRLAGLEDELDGFAPGHPLLRQLSSRYTGLRFARSDLVLESLVPAILSQKITGKEAFASWRRLLQRHGAPAPGPGPSRLRVPPSAATLRALDDAQWHALGVDRAHRETVRRVARRPAALERLLEREPADAAERLQSIRGVGVWTAAEVVERAWGAADLPSFGDYHIPTIVGLSLIGEPVDDARMAELLEGYRPHRGRVVRLIELGGVSRPRRGPRRTVPDYRAI